MHTLPRQLYYTIRTTPRRPAPPWWPLSFAHHPLSGSVSLSDENNIRGNTKGPSMENTYFKESLSYLPLIHSQQVNHFGHTLQIGKHGYDI